MNYDFDIYKDKYEKVALQLNEIINKKGEKSKNKKFCLIGNKRV